MAKDLVTRAQYKAYLGITGDSQNSEIDSLIPRISALVKAYCRRSFIDYVDDAKVEKFNGDTDRFMLQEYPVLQVISVEYSEDYGQTYTDLVEYTDYVWDTNDDSIVSIASTTFPKLINGYVVSYYCGFETLPTDLTLAIFDLITYYLKNDAVTHNVRMPFSGNTLQLEYVRADTFPSHISRVLNLYKASWD